MLRKILRWSLIIVSILLLLLVIAGTALYVYVDNNREEAIREFAGGMGLEFTYADASLTAWSSWPRVTLHLDSVTLRDQQRADLEPLFRAGRVDAVVNFDRIWSDTLRFEQLIVSDGGFFLTTDSTGHFNIGELASDRDTTASTSSSEGPFTPYFSWEDAAVALTNFDLAFVDSLKNKDFKAHLDSLRTTAKRLPDGHPQFLAGLDAHVGGLAFNTEKGAYLRDADLRASFTVTRSDTAWVLDTTVLRVGADTYGLFGTFGRKDSPGIHLNITNDETIYENARRLLHDSLAARLAAYHVNGPFPVRARVYSHPDYGGDTKVVIDFSTDDQAINLNGFHFNHVTTSGTFVNRLAPDEGGAGSRRDFRIETKPTVAYYDGMRIETPRAIVRGKDNEPFLDSPITLSGNARALARLFGNTNFLFTDGRFRMVTHVDASLMSVPDIIESSNGTLALEDLDVDYEAAGVRFAFSSIVVRKSRDDVSFQLNSGDFPAGVDFAMQGQIDNILPLLLERPTERIRTKVQFYSDALDWEDFRTLFGQAATAKGGSGTAAVVRNAAQVQSMKRTLLGLRESFNPHLTVDIGKMGYYDVMKIDSFRTGVRFDGDAMVLEKTTFSYGDGKLTLDGRFAMGTFRITPFSVHLAADHLNLDKLRQPLGAFGLRLPAGIKTLPEALRVRFSHQGIINDTFGISPGHNVGTLDFSDSRQGLFSGNVRYAPEGGRLRTHLLLTGDPVLVNDLFAAEDFFFEAGRFAIEVDVPGVPSDLRELVQSATLGLRIDSTILRYRPAGAFVPIRSFRVNSQDNHTTVDLQLASDATRSAVILRGELDRLTAFLYPERGETFSVRADASARRLHASDVATFIQFDSLGAPDNRADTFDLQQLVSAGTGIFNSFRPDLSLQIDTFDVKDDIRFTNVHTGLRIRDSTLLMLEKTGFNTPAGQLELSGTYDLDRRQRSPFTLQWRTDSVKLREILQTLHQLGLADTSRMGFLRGVLATSGDVTGRMNERSRQPVLEQSHAGITLRLSPAEIADWPGMQAVGRKMRMKKRFARVFTAPLDITVTIDTGTINIPRTEFQTSALQAFVQGRIDTARGPDLLVSIPVFANLWRGKLDAAPPKTGYARAGWKVFLLVEPGEDGSTKTRFRLGRRRYYKERGGLAEFRRIKAEERKKRRAARRGRQKH